MTTPRAKTVLPAQFLPAASIYNHHAVLVAPDMTVEDILSPETWVHVARRLRQHDIIEAIAEDASFRVRITVRSITIPDVGTPMMRLALLDENRFNDGAELDVGAYKVAWNVGSKTFVIKRASDGKQMRDGFKTREEAEDWLNAHTAPVAA